MWFVCKILVEMERCTLFFFLEFYFLFTLYIITTKRLKNQINLLEIRFVKKSDNCYEKSMADRMLTRDIVPGKLIGLMARLIKD